MVNSKHSILKSKQASKLSQKGFKRTLLSACVLASSASAIAQEGAQVEEILVLGTRSEIENAAQMKREAATHIDAISATDISSLPDKSVLEAVQRLPGVSIERFAGANDADHFSVEGSGIVIRGLTQTRSEFNGRDSFSANTDGGLSFQDVPPELLGSVQLVKNQTASMTEGGISGTINLITRKPFDSEDRKISGTIKANYADRIEEVTPSISLLFSDQWETDAGTFGVLGSISGSNLTSRADGVQVYPILFRTDNPTSPNHLPALNLVDDQGQPLRDPNGNLVEESFASSAVQIRRQDYDRDRLGGALVLQWRSPNDKLTGTFEVIHSDSSQAYEEHALEFSEQPFGGLPGNPQLLVGAPQAVSFDSGAPIVTLGTYINGGGRSDNVNSYTRDQLNESEITDVSLGFDFEATDRLTLSADLQYVDASYEQKDIFAIANINSDYYVDLRGSTPQVQFLGEAVVDPTSPTGVNSAHVLDATGNTPNPLLDKDSVFLRAILDHAEQDDGDLFAVEFDAEYEIDSGWAQSIEVGARFSEREQVIRSNEYNNWGNVSETWNGGISSTFTDLDAQNDNLTDVFTFDDFHNGNVLLGEQTFAMPNLSLVDVDRYFELESRVDPIRTGNFLPLYERTGLVPGTIFRPGEINTSTQKNKAVYAQLNFANEDDFAVRISGNVGLRVVSYDWDLAGLVNFPTNSSDALTNPNASAEDQLTVANSVTEEFIRVNFPDDYAFATFAPSPTDAPNVVTDSYEKILPSFNLKVGLTDELIARFAYSKAIALPDARDKRNRVNIVRDDNNIFDLPQGDPNRQLIDVDIVGYRAGGTNPLLQPIEADQFDLSLEWYFGSGNTLTGSLFYKEVSGFIRNGSATVGNFTNNTVTRPVAITGPTNGDDGIIQGFELAYTQFFDMLPEPFDGLGVQASYTYIDQDGISANDLDPQGAAIANNGAGNFGNFQGLPLEGLSKDTINFILMYEKYGVNARLAYNYRSDYLLTSRDVITFLPNAALSTDTLDASISYQVLDQLKVGLEFNNILDETNRLNQVFTGDLSQGLRSQFVTDRRVALAVTFDL